MVFMGMWLEVSHLRVGKEDVVLIELLDQDPAFVLMFFFVAI